MSFFTAQEVAAAILYLDSGEMDYKDIDRAVRNTGLSGLGKTGKTPWQTIRVKLDKAYQSEFIFERSIDEAGHYYLLEPDKMKKHKKIWIAVQLIKRERLKSEIFRYLEELKSSTIKLVDFDAYNYITLENNNIILEHILESTKRGTLTNL